MEHDELSLSITIHPPVAGFVREMAEIVGITPDELALAAVSHIVYLPIPAAVGICQSYLDIDAEDVEEDETDPIDETA
jgi:hypothetical protein